MFGMHMLTIVISMVEDREDIGTHHKGAQLLAQLPTKGT